MRTFTRISIAKYQTNVTLRRHVIDRAKVEVIQHAFDWYGGVLGADVGGDGGERVDEVRELGGAGAPAHCEGALGAAFAAGDVSVQVRLS